MADEIEVKKFLEAIEKLGEYVAEDTKNRRREFIHDFCTELGAFIAKITDLKITASEAKSACERGLAKLREERV